MPRQSVYIFLCLIGTLVSGSLVLNGPRMMIPGALPRGGSGAPGDSLDVPGVPESVAEFLENGQAWRAARVMRTYLASTPDASPAAILLAARAEAGWGGWARVREDLEGRSWLGSESGGLGWYWLGRALENDEEWEDALDAYTKFLDESSDAEQTQRRLVAQLRQGLILLRLGRIEEGAKHLQAVRSYAPKIEPRLNVLAAEALAVSGDTAGVRRLLGRPEESDLVRRSRRALLVAYDSSGDLAATRAHALRYGAAASSAGERAFYNVKAARLALELGDTAAARGGLNAAVREVPASGAAATAAEILIELGDLTAADHLAIARTFDLNGRNATAATHYRAWLDADAGTAAERRTNRLRLANALFDAGSYSDAITAVAPLTDESGTVGAEALYLEGRAEMRRGNDARAQARFLTLADRHPGTTAGSEGLFLVADLSHDARKMDDARTVYRRVADDFHGSDRAGLSLMRLGGIAFQQKRYSDAAKIWEEYRTSYPRGQRWLESTYWAGRSYDELGEHEKADSLYRAVRRHEPLSYYSLEGNERLGVPYWPIPMGPSPASSDSVRARADSLLRGVDLLDQAGLYDEAGAEADRVVDGAGNDTALLYALAEALNARGLTARGINLGNRLLNHLSRPNARVLRIIYPFPYRAMLTAEAAEKDLDPFLVAALIRQESAFKARVSSGVGARGLMQVMPQTGRALAASADITHWQTSMLYQPEINAHLGMRFLADQMNEYDGSLPSVFAAYNAGPSRVDRWKSFPEYGDDELFTERIPYRETRDYVKILTRNIAIYRGLYESASAGDTGKAR